MKITKIEKVDGVYEVTSTPNWFEKFFGLKEEIRKYKSTGEEYMFGGGHVYVDQTGRELGNHMGWGSSTREAIDRWRRSW